MQDFIERWNLSLVHVQMLFGVTEQTVCNWQKGGNVGPVALRLLEILTEVEAVQPQLVNRIIYDLKMARVKTRARLAVNRREEARRKRLVKDMLSGKI